MRLALITTTINVPKVLALYRKFGPDVPFFVAGDHKTPVEAVSFCEKLGNCRFYSPQDQRDLGYKCSELIGFNNDSRRNIALLEAVKSGAEIILSVDDDMLVCGPAFFHQIHWPFEDGFTGLKLGLPGHWMNHTCFTMPGTLARGLPLDVSFATQIGGVVDAKIGAIQGIILGTPDSAATDAITNRSFVHSASDILRNGFVAHPDCLTVFNSQLTAFRRELAPGFAQFYKWQGRNTDIFASLIMRRMMQAMDMYTYYGPPMGFHAREARPLFKDLKAEMYGLEHIEEFAAVVNEADILMDMTPVEMCRSIYDSLEETDWFDGENYYVAQAFLDDIEGVL